MTPATSLNCQTSDTALPAAESAPTVNGPARAPEAASDGLDAFFRPHNVALIGASDTPGSVGAALTRNLLCLPAGRFYPVNPRHRTIAGRTAWPSLAAIGASIDLAVIATPASTVPEVVSECVDLGVRAAIIISAGFRETGPEGGALEHRIRAEAARNGLRLLGPNCLGLMSPHAGLNATFAAHAAEPGRVAFISQSGALCTAILDWSRREHVGFSAFVSVGSMIDVGWGDLIGWLARDPHTESILIYMESIGDPRSFLAAARQAAHSKPIIVIKVGHTEAAARAAASHTGALTGSDEVLDAAFRRAGVLRVARIEELFEMAEVLAKQPLPRGPRLAMVTNAGGPGALATDALVSSGGEVAQIAPATLHRLDSVLPAHWSHGNPIDILGDAGPARFAAALGAVATDPASDGALVILTPQSMTDPTACAAAMVEAVRDSGKTVLASWMGGADVDAGRRILSGAGIPQFDYPDAAARAFALMWERARALRGLDEPPPAAASPGDHPARASTDRILREAADAAATMLPKAECTRILEAYEIPTLQVITATSVTQAVEGALRIGFPVVMKLHSATITHKTDVGGVKLGLGDELAVRHAWQETRAAVPAADFLGVTVEPMIDAAGGYELILGCSHDAQFGPVLLFGAGGQMVEVFKDYDLGLPPLSQSLALGMIERTRIAKALRGIRGRPPLDLDALAGILVRFARLAADHPRIREMEINPLLGTAEGFLALDVRILLHGQEIAEGELPRAVMLP